MIDDPTPSRHNPLIGPNTVDIKLDIKKLVAYFGGRINLWRKLNAAGYVLSIKTIEKWSERDSLPAHRIVQLMDLAKRDGRVIDLNSFLLNSAPNAEKKLSPNTDEKQKVRSSR